MLRWGRTAAVLAGLAVLVAFAYAPVWNAGFVSDDDLYVKLNPTVRGGLTWAGVRWALTTGHAANWHPLTWVSLMADASLLGEGPRGFHLVNVLYHGLGAWLTFLVLARLTGAFWRPALVAALFAAHPLHVESVAWVAERKDVLSAALFWLTIGAWLSYLRRPGPGRWALATVLLGLGLSAKPMLVTLPFALLLLDLWPLGRWRPGSGGARALVLEKWPWFLLAAGSSVLTYVAQSRGEAVQSLEDLPFGWRAGNALLSYLRYLRLAIWPHSLSPVHPFAPTPPDAARAALAALLILAALLLGLRALRRRPWVAVGGLWYLGLLVPVIGLVQVGGQTMADRYTYLPLTGFFVAALWGAGGFLRGRPALRVVAAVLATAALGALAAAARTQARAWESGVSLYRHALAVGADHERWMAHYGLGIALQDAGEGSLAAGQYREAVRLRPSFPGAHSNLGVVLTDAGRPERALGHFEEAIRLAPEDPRAYYGRGRALARLGRLEEAVAMYRAALGRKPDLHEVLTDLGAALAGQGRAAEAVAALEEAVRRLPESPRARYFLGHALARAGRLAEAVGAYREALRLRPDYPEAWTDLGVALARAGRLGEAEGALREALRLRPEDATARYNLGLTLAARERHAEAVGEYLEALRLRPDLAEARSDLGVSYAALGRDTEALAQFREAVRLQPGLEAARVNLERASARSRGREARRDP